MNDLTHEAKWFVARFLAAFLVAGAGIFIFVASSYKETAISAARLIALEEMRSQDVRLDEMREEYARLAERTSNTAAEAQATFESFELIRQNADDVQRTIDILGDLNRSRDELASDLADLIRPDVTSRNSIIPVGTIIASMLSPEQLNDQFSQQGTWVPADGRAAPQDSIYTRVTGRQLLPDLRGSFLRAVNDMGPGGANPVEARLDTDDREIGDYQEDTFKTHDHGGTYSIFQPQGIGGASHANVVARGGTGSQRWAVQSEGGLETRPKNVSVMYYIKIQ